MPVTMETPPVSVINSGRGIRETNKVIHIRIYLNAQVLKTGVILADLPGETFSSSFVIAC